MARGYPDYFGYSTFLQYGQPQMPPIAVPLVPSGLFATEIWNIAYKGMTMGGYIILEPIVNNPANLYLTSLIDGVAGNAISVTQAYEWNLPHETGALFSLTEYNFEAARYVYKLSKGFTFDHELVLYAGNTTGANCNTSGAIWIAQVV